MIDLWQEQQLATRDERARVSPIRLELETVAVLLTTVAVVLLIRYLGIGSRAGWVPDGLDLVGFDGAAADLDEAWTTSASADFNRHVYWASFRVVAYVVPAWLVAHFVLGRSLRSLGLRWDGSWPHVRVYLAMYLLMLPLVLLASTSGEFQDQYPLYDQGPGEALWPRLLVWEALYFAQFVGLEIFFRGFVLHGLARRFGILAIMMMVVPYVAIHFTKPWPEAVGSIVAGTVLGFFSLRTGAMWWGAALHFGVALTIDLLVL